MDRPGRPEARQSAHSEKLHDRYRSLLPVFAMERLSAGPSGQDWHALEAHLGDCPSCREELAELLELLEETVEGTLVSELTVPEAAPYRPWHLAPQPPGPAAVVSVAVAGFRRILVEFTEALRWNMQQPALDGRFRFGQTGEQEPGHGPTDAPLSSADSPDEYRYELDSAQADDVAVAFDFALKDPERKRYEMRVTVIAPEWDPYSQHDHHVTVHFEAHSVEGLTDASGCVVFRDLPYEALAQLQITILPRHPGH